MRHIHGTKKNGKLGQAECTPPTQPGCPPAEQAGAHPSPLTQNQLRTPCTPLTAQKGKCTSAPHMADDASSHRPTPEPGAACADENWPQPTSQEAPKPLQGLGLRPDSAASAASNTQQAVDMEDVRGLVLAVESLQRQVHACCLVRPRQCRHKQYHESAVCGLPSGIDLASGMQLKSIWSWLPLEPGAGSLGWVAAHVFTFVGVKGVSMPLFGAAVRRAVFMYLSRKLSCFASLAHIYAAGCEERPDQGIEGGSADAAAGSS